MYVFGGRFGPNRQEKPPNRKPDRTVRFGYFSNYAGVPPNRQKRSDLTLFDRFEWSNSFFNTPNLNLINLTDNQLINVSLLIPR